MTKLSKDDPIYYKVAMNKLIKQAKENGLLIDYSIIENFSGVSEIRVNFEADNGDIASAVVYDKKRGD